MYDDLMLKVGLMISRAEQGYEVTLFNDAESEHRLIPVGSSFLLVERVTFDANDRPFEHVKGTYHGDRYRVTTSLRYWPAKHRLLRNS